MAAAAHPREDGLDDVVDVRLEAGRRQRHLDLPARRCIAAAARAVTLLPLASRHTQTHTRTHAHIHTHTHTQLTRRHTHTHARTRKRTPTHTRARARGTHTRMHAHAHTHTHPRTRIHARQHACTPTHSERGAHLHAGVVRAGGVHERVERVDPPPPAQGSILPLWHHNARMQPRARAQPQPEPLRSPPLSRPCDHSLPNLPPRPHHHCAAKEAPRKRDSRAKGLFAKFRCGACAGQRRRRRARRCRSDRAGTPAAGCGSTCARMFVRVCVRVCVCARARARGCV